MLGRFLGNKVLSYVNRSPNLSWRLDRLGEAIHAAVPSYIPGKTREAHKLFQYAEAHTNQTFVVKTYGIYAGKVLVAGNEYLSAFMKAQKITSFRIPEKMVMEEFISATRSRPIKSFGKVFGIAGFVLGAIIGPMALFSPEFGRVLPDFTEGRMNDVFFIYPLYALPRAIHSEVESTYSYAKNQKLNFLWFGLSMLLLLAAETPIMRDCFSYDFPVLGHPEALDMPIPILTVLSAAWYFKAKGQNNLAELLLLNNPR